MPLSCLILVFLCLFHDWVTVIYIFRCTFNGVIVKCSNNRKGKEWSYFNQIAQCFSFFPWSVLLVISSYNFWNLQFSMIFLSNFKKRAIMIIAMFSQINSVELRPKFFKTPINRNFLNSMRMWEFYYPLARCEEWRVLSVF